MSAHVTFWGRYKQVLATPIENSGHCKVVSQFPKVGHQLTRGCIFSITFWYFDTFSNGDIDIPYNDINNINIFYTVTYTSYTPLPY